MKSWTLGHASSCALSCEGPEVVLEPAPGHASVRVPAGTDPGRRRHPPDAHGHLRWIAEHHRVLGLPLIVDEIQTGCGRTGRFLALAETPLALDEPEYVVLSKALGGGLVKIAATLIRSDILDPDFGILHTSTFGEDEFSCLIAQRVLDILTRDDGRVMEEVADKGAIPAPGARGVAGQVPGTRQRSARSGTDAGH